MNIQYSIAFPKHITVFYLLNIMQLLIFIMIARFYIHSTLITQLFPNKKAAL